MNVYPNSRKVVQYYNYANGRDGNGGHGTAVTSTIAGKRSYSQGVAVGVAPNAKIAFFDISDNSDPDNGVCCCVPSNFRVFLNQARLAGAKIHNISWGSATDNNYITYDCILDSFIYYDQDSIIVVAAGNKGPGANTVGSSTNAKNVITGR